MHLADLADLLADLEMDFEAIGGEIATAARARADVGGDVIRVLVVPSVGRKAIIPGRTNAGHKAREGTHSMMRTTRTCRCT